MMVHKWHGVESRQLFDLKGEKKTVIVKRVKLGINSVTKVYRNKYFRSNTVRLTVCQVVI